MIEKKQLLRALRWCMAVCLSLVCANPAVASKTTYYYQATANVSPTGSGLVYVGTNQTSTPDYKATSNVSGSARGYNNGRVTVFFYAQENDGYIFDRWVRGNATVSNSSSFNTELVFNSESQTNPNKFTYTAVFTEQKGLVKVQVAEAGRGTVSISNPNNTLNSTVTLRANPDASNGVVFLGWNKNRNDTENFISTANSYTLQVTNATAGTYYAHFSEAAERVYVRLRNKQTGRFLSLYGWTEAGTHTRSYKVGNRTYNNVADGFIFTGGLKMISAADAQGNPMTVFLRNSNPAGIGVNNNGDLVANNIQYSDLVSADDNTNSYPLTMELTSDGVRIYTSYTTSIDGNSATFRTYLCDEGNANGWAVMKSIQDLTGITGLDWDVYLLSGNTTDGALGANTKAKYTRDGKYYTTMYAPFAYQLLDGVKAYYLPFSEESYNEETNSVVFTEFTEGIVPECTAVVLECADIQNANGEVSGVKNRLLPLPEGAGAAYYVNPSLNLLKGYISINGSTVANNPSLMYVLSYDRELGFYHYNKETMTPCKAYLELPESVDEYPQAANATFLFGQSQLQQPEQPTGITLSETAVDDEAGTVYDLTGRRVPEGARQPHGIYITKGKKYMIK